MYHRWRHPRLDSNHGYDHDIVFLPYKPRLILGIIILLCTFYM